MSAYENETYSGVMYVTPEPEVAYYPGNLFSLAEVAEFVKCKQSEIEQYYGFYKRWSMPGYLDCGDWEQIHQHRLLTPKSKYWVEPKDA